MRKIHRSLIAILLSVFTAWGCAQRDEQKMLEESSPESVTLEVSLGGSSRAERFLGTYDQNERLALDIVRNYGNKQAIRRGTFSSVNDLVKKIDQFVEHYNTNTKPFVWTATADSIFEKIKRLCQGISETQH